MAKFTPGPFTIGEDSTTTVVAKRTDGRMVPVALCYDPNDHSHRTSVSEANANLFAAAPELLDALKDLLDSAADISMTFDGGQSDSHARLTCRCKFCALERSFLLARDAIAKAEGVSK